jgi:hypothetical protein
VTTSQREGLGLLRPSLNSRLNFADHNGFVFDKGAVIEAIGMPGFKINGLPALLTRRLTSGKLTLRLRDESGRPVWN